MRFQQSARYLSYNAKVRGCGARPYIYIYIYICSRLETSGNPNLVNKAPNLNLKKQNIASVGYMKHMCVSEGLGSTLSARSLPSDSRPPASLRRIWTKLGENSAYKPPGTSYTAQGPEKQQEIIKSVLLRNCIQSKTTISYTRIFSVRGTTLKL